MPPLWEEAFIITVFGVKFSLIYERTEASYTC